MDGQYKISSIFAFIVVDTDGTEGVPAMLGGLPMMGADLAMVNRLRPFAQVFATQTGRPVTLAHFSVRTDQETIQP